MKCILISAQLESKARRTAHKWNSASYGEASSDHNNKGWIPSKVTAELSPSLWSVRSDSTALWEGIPNDASQNAVYWGPWHLSLLFPDHFSFHLPSRLSLSILKRAGDIFAGWLSDPCPGRRWRFQQEVWSALSHILLTHAQPRQGPFWWRQKPDTTLNFISPGHMIWRGKKER